MIGQVLIVHQPVNNDDHKASEDAALLNVWPYD